MPPATRSGSSRQNQRRPPHIEVFEQDDESESTDSEEEVQPRSKRRRISEARPRRTATDDAEESAGGSNSAGPGESTSTPIEIDDVGENSKLSTLLQKQRADQVLSQNASSSKPLKLGDITCVICMENPTDLTATSCGHVFCHECLMHAIIASENRGPDHRKGQCPVCRKMLSRTKVTATGVPDISPLLLKKAPKSYSLEEMARVNGVCLGEVVSKKK